MLRFEWDENKNERNFRKHGMWFEEAVTVFQDPRGRLFFDYEHSTREDRFLLLGMNVQARIIVVVHLHREQEQIVRIISARKATKKEIRVYEERI